MSDIGTFDSSCVFGNQNQGDNLVEFLTKFVRFGIDQCSHLAHLLTNQQRSIGNISTVSDDKRVIQVKQLLMAVQTLETEFHDIFLIISSSDDRTKQLLFVKLQNYLSNLLDIHVRFKSFDFSTKEISGTTQSAEKSDRSLSTISSLSNIPQITISSPCDFNNEMIDIGKNWKFANIIPTRCEMSFIASNAREIVCYNNQNHFLHLILITGQFLENIKWHHDPIIDLIWCSLIDRYIAVTGHAVYTIQYNRSRSSKSNLIVDNKVLGIEQFHSARIACNSNNILLYITRQQTSSIEIYDRQFNLIRLFPSFSYASHSFCCTNTFIALTEKEDVLISHFPYVTPKKITLLIFDIDTFQLRYTVDLDNCSNIYTMKCLAQYNVFFALSDEKILWIINVDNNETVQIAKKPLYTNQTEMCVINDRDLLLINVNAGHAIQLIKYRKIQQ